MLTSIHAISLDIWKTILQSNPQFKPLQTQLFAKTFGTEVNTDWQNILKKADQKADILAESEGIDIGFVERLEFIAAASGLKMPDSSQEIERLYAHMETLFLAHPPVLLEKNLLDILAALQQKGLRLFLLSNTGFIKGRSMRKVLEKLKISFYIEKTVFSDEVGYAKPHPRIFEALCLASQLKPQNILHIGDNLLADYAGAKKFGITSLCYNPNNLYFANRIHQINSLTTLLHL